MGTATKEVGTTVVTELCDECGEAEGTNADCSVCQEVSTRDASRSTAKVAVGSVAPRETRQPRAFTSSGRVD